VLLVALARGQRGGGLDLALRAIHVDHGLHADSALWSQACVDLAREWDVPCEIVRVVAHATPGESPEAAARDARYAALHERLQPGEVLLTAHHADDQLETVLLQWLRGGGLRAVAGMEKVARLGESGWHARPLLDFTREELRAWATVEGLHWLEDPSNVDRRYDRNYLRHEVLPVLLQRWPGAARTVGRVAEFARDALALEAEVAAADLAHVGAGAALDLPALLQLPEPRQRAVLRAWLQRLQLPLPAADTLAALRRDVARAAADRIPEVRWPGVVVHRYRDRLYAEAAQTEDVREGEWVGPEPYAWSDDSTLEWVADTGTGLSRERLPDRLAVRRRRGGEVFQPDGGAHRRELRKWLQEHDVLPWRREHIPLLFDAKGQLVAVADLAVAAGFAARPGEPSWRVAWNRNRAVTVAEATELKWREDPPIR
jgi:tRNA(Ile)-lysidine synthase